MKKKSIITKLSFTMNLLIIFLMTANASLLYYFCLIYEPMILEKRFNEIIVLEVILTASGIFVGFFVIRALCKKIISKQLTELTKGAQKLSTGNLTSRIKIKNLDELGGLATAINNMTVYLINLLESVKFTAEELSKSGKSLINKTGKANNEFKILNGLTEKFTQELEKAKSIFQKMREVLKKYEKSIQSIQEKSQGVNEILQKNLNDTSSLVGNLHISNRDLGHQVNSFKKISNLLNDFTGANHIFAQLTKNHLELLKSSKNLVLQIALDAAESGEKEKARDARKLHDLIKNLETEMQKINSKGPQLKEILKEVERNLLNSGKNLEEIQKSVLGTIKTFENLGLTMRECSQTMETIYQLSLDGEECCQQAENTIQNGSETFQEIIKQASDISQTTSNQYKLLREIEPPVKKVARMSDRLHTLSLQFKT